MDYEHRPTEGPGAWIGAGLLAAVGGATLVWAGASSGGAAMVAIGSILVVVGVGVVAGGLWNASVRRRR